jgi:hypothetical protein
LGNSPLNIDLSILFFTSLQKRVCGKTLRNSAARRQVCHAGLILDCAVILSSFIMGIMAAASSLREFLRARYFEGPLQSVRAPPEISALKFCR